MAMFVGVLSLTLLQWWKDAWQQCTIASACSSVRAGRSRYFHVSLKNCLASSRSMLSPSDAIRASASVHLSTERYGCPGGKGKPLAGGRRAQTQRPGGALPDYYPLTPASPPI